ncbi:uncharacterized protein ELE39_000263 [Cryptosporidium sp. chipmunk genotype I]|uniref:uncharacterized protein n=1 Tax=Cryptosporidium sp. chipmunk genotype I TaxID=1280935 RepID=UPI00351A773F|nr:hypothetical protein ELE39_000263 [Cryptosporidium sp. chipmunk genotype I]
MRSNLGPAKSPPASDTNQFAIWELSKAPTSPTSSNSPNSEYLLNPSASTSDPSGLKFEPKCSSCEIYFRRMNGLENELQILTNNIYCLFKTAKEEIQRKDKLIQEKDEIIRQLKKTKMNKQYSK